MPRRTLRQPYWLGLIPALLWLTVRAASLGDEPPRSFYLPSVSASAPILIRAAHIDSVLSGEPDEAIQLQNMRAYPQSLAGWQLATATRRATIALESTLSLGPFETLWCAAQAGVFQITFGFLPACEWAGDHPDVPDLSGALALNNSSGLLRLLDPQGRAVDLLAYSVDGADPMPALGSLNSGWQGMPAQPYRRGALSASGQIWQRKTYGAGGLPLDSDRALDWAGDLADLAWGRRVRYPGWQDGQDPSRGRPFSGRAQAEITLAIGPEGLYAPLAAQLANAVATIDLNLFTLEHPQLAEILAGRAARGVRVRILLEGNPPGGISQLQRWSVAQIAAAGGDIRYMAAQSDTPRGLQARYRYNHAKYGLIDDTWALLGTENFSQDAMPLPDVATQANAQGEVSGGRRGVYLITNAPPVRDALATLFAGDWQPERFADLHPYTPDDARYGAPPPTFQLPAPPFYGVDVEQCLCSQNAGARLAQPLVTSGEATFMLASAPENALHPDDGLHGLLQRAGAGDAIHLQQLYEHKYWGDGDSNPIADPNPRLQLIIDAARRGAQVRVLLDSYFDEPEALRSNRATVDYLHALAAAEGLDIQARTGNPTGGGIHAKLVLVRVGGETWSAIGSLNGGEISHKVNREVMLLVDAPTVYDRLLAVFLHDWALVTR